MAPRVYLETTIPSYLTAGSTTDVIRAARQQLTREWWDTRRHGFELCASELVVKECGGGHPDAAAARLAMLAGVAVLARSAEAEALTAMLIAKVPFPPNAEADAAHVAIAAVHAVEYLLTWNCARLAKPNVRKRVETVCVAAGFRPPVILTPGESLKRG